MKTIKTKKCIVCGKEYTKRTKTQKYCSHKCRNVVFSKCNIGRANSNGFKKGNIAWNKYLIEISCGNCLQLFQPRESRNKYCSRKCARAKQVVTTESRKKSMATRLERYGHINSPETRAKLTKIFKGNNSHLWRGGVSSKNHIIRQSLEYREWRKAVFERDNYTCQHCGRRGGKLNADHIKPFAKYPRLRFKFSNGRTLCFPCHRQTPTYARNFK